MRAHLERDCNLMQKKCTRCESVTLKRDEKKHQGSMVHFKTKINDLTGEITSLKQQLVKAAQQTKTAEDKIVAMNQENQKNVKLLSEVRAQSSAKDEQLKNLQN